MARYLGCADTVRRADADLERATDARDSAAIRAEVARGPGRARRLSSDGDQPPDHWLRAGGRRRAGLTLRIRVLVRAGVHRNLLARKLLPAGVRSHRGRD